MSLDLFLTSSSLSRIINSKQLEIKDMDKIENINKTQVGLKFINGTLDISNALDNNSKVFIDNQGLGYLSVINGVKTISRYYSKKIYDIAGYQIVNIPTNSHFTSRQEIISYKEVKGYISYTNSYFFIDGGVVILKLHFNYYIYAIPNSYNTGQIQTNTSLYNTTTTTTTTTGNTTITTYTFTGDKGNIFKFTVSNSGEEGSAMISP
jgi:hypothetical protein